MRHYNLTLQTAPTIEPVTRQEAKDFALIEHTADDGLIDTYIKAATDYVEDVTGRQLINATYDLRLDTFPAEILVPKPPLSSVTSITYTDSDDSSQTVATSVYQSDIYSVPGRIRPKLNQSWPTDVKDDTYNVIAVKFVAGYGAAASSVPEQLKQAIKLLVSHMYTFREPIVAGTTPQHVPMAFDALIGQFRVHEEQIES